MPGDVILCCDACYAARKIAFPLVADAAGNAWCPQCGKQWEELSNAPKKEVQPPDSDTVGPVVCAGPCSPEGSDD